MPDIQVIAISCIAVIFRYEDAIFAQGWHIKVVVTDKSESDVLHGQTQKSTLLFKIINFKYK